MVDCIHIGTTMIL